MSFDLGVWRSERPLNDKEAGEIYVKLCEEWPFLEGESPRVLAFYDELIAHWPELDTVSEERVDDVEFCPWSCALSHSGMAVVMSCVWSMAEKVAMHVGELASKHELVLYDPQTGRVYLPTCLAPTKRGLFARIFGV